MARKRTGISYLLIVFAIVIIAVILSTTYFRDRKNNDALWSSETVSENAEFKFVVPKMKGVTGEGHAVPETEVINLYLDNNIYYPVYLPIDLEIVTDYSKYIYAKDNSVSVAVVSNVPWGEFSEFVGIEDAVSLQPNLIRSKEGRPGPQEAAKHIANDKAVIIRCYDSPDTFATILQGLERDTYVVTNYGGLATEEKKTTVLNKLPLYTGYHVTINVGLVDNIQKIYTFEDGSLTITREFKRYGDAVEAIGTKAAVIAKGNIADKVYASEDIYYAEKGNYTVAIYQSNFNTAITLFGEGEEARFNMIAYLKEM